MVLLLPFPPFFVCWFRHQLPDIHFKHETGAMGFAVDPSWNKGDKYIYVYYGNQVAGSMLLSRFTHVENEGQLTSRADVESEVVLWKDTDNWGTKKGGQLWHYGGQVHFGPDDNIYIPLGDKYTETMQKSSKYHAGCVVRVTKTGAIPAGNLPPTIKPEACWAYGIRNGYSSYWDLETNRFFYCRSRRQQQGLERRPSFRKARQTLWLAVLRRCMRQAKVSKL